MTEAPNLPEREPDNSPGGEAARVTHIRSRGFSPRPPVEVNPGILTPAASRVEPLIVPPVFPEEAVPGYIPQEPELTHKENKGIPLKAKLAGAAATLAVTAAGVFGYSKINSSSEDKANIIISPAPTQVIPGTEIPNPLKTPEVTAIPTPKSGFSEKDGAFTFRTEKGEVLNVPQIEGLTAKLVKVGDVEEIQYFAKEGNQYGVEVNTSVGEYNPNVDIYENSQRKELGGVVLEPRVVKRLMDETLAKIPEQSDKWVVVSPVDISTVVNSDVLLSFEPNINTQKIVLKISFTEVLPLLNVIPGDPNIKITKNPVYNWGYLDNIRNTAPYNDSILPGKEMNYIVVGGNFINAKDQFISKKTLGEQVAEVEDKVYVGYSFGGGAWDVGRNKILSVGNNIPVFLQSSGSGK